MEKVAIASSDGRSINEHFGQAGQFFIYSIEDDDSIDFVERRPVIFPPNTPESEFLAAKAALLADVDMLLCVKLGPAAQRELEKQGITVYSYSGEIKSVLAKYVKRRHLLKNLAKSEASYLESCISRGGCSSSSCGASGCG